MFASLRARETTAAMYASHGHVVLRRARQILRDEEEAQDVLQEVFASLVQTPAQFDGKSAPTTFLYRVTTNRCLNRLRDRSTRLRLLKQEPREEAVAPRGESRIEMRQLLAKLPDDLAQAVVYYYVDEMTHEEIADQMGCSRRQVGNLLERAAAFWKEEEVQV